MNSVSLDHAQHLGLYSAFHRSHENRRIHVVALGGVFASALCGVALLPGLLAWAGPLLAIALAATFFRLHRGASAMVLVLGLTASAIASLVTRVVSAEVVLAVSMAVHLACWWISVRVGHVGIEPMVETPAGREDSNLYFRRGYFHGKDVGPPLSLVDRWTQFCVAALASTWDVLELFGISNPDREAIGVVRARVLENVRVGQAPLSGLQLAA